MVGVSIVPKIRTQPKETEEEKQVLSIKNNFLDLDARTNGKLALEILRKRDKKVPSAPLTQLEIEKIITSATKEELLDISLEKRFSISKSDLDNILKTAGLSSNKIIAFYKNGSKSLSETEKSAVEGLLKSEGFLKNEIESLLSSPTATKQEWRAMFNGFDFVQQETSSSSGISIVVTPFPSKPKMTADSFAEAVAIAMSIVIRERAVSQTLDTGNAERQLKNTISAMEEKIRITQAEAKINVREAYATQNRIQQMKAMQAFLSFLAIIASIILAAVTVVVSVFTFGAGTAPMILATIGAITGMISGVVSGSLSASDALRSDGKSWTDSIARGGVDTNKKYLSAQEQEAMRYKKESILLAKTIIESVFDAISIIMSFGTALAAIAIKNVVQQSMKAMLSAMLIAMRQMIGRTITMFVSVIVSGFSKLLSALIQSGRLTRSLAEGDLDNTSEKSTRKELEVRYNTLKKSFFFKKLANEFGLEEAEKKLDAQMGKEIQAIISGDVAAIVDIRRERLEYGIGSQIYDRETKRLEEEAQGSIDQAIINEMTLFQDVQMKVEEENRALMIGLTIGSAVAAFMSALASIAGTYNTMSKEVSTAGRLIIQREARLLQSMKKSTDDIYERLIDLESEASEAIQTISKWRHVSEMAQFFTETLRASLTSIATIFQTTFQTESLEEQKRVSDRLAKIQAALTALEAQLFALSIVSNSSIEIQEKLLESFKQSSEAFIDFWKSVELTFAVGIQNKY